MKYKGGTIIISKIFDGLRMLDLKLYSDINNWRSKDISITITWMSFS